MDQMPQDISANIISQIYETLLGREIDSDRVSDKAKMIMNGEPNVGEILANIFRSSEFQKNLPAFLRRFELCPIDKSTYLSDNVKSGLLEKNITAIDLEILFQIILKRSVKNDLYIDEIAKSGISLKDYLSSMRHCDEFYRVTGAELAARGRLQLSEDDLIARNRRQYRNPLELRVSESSVSRVAMIGSCFIMNWLPVLRNFRPRLKTDLFLIGAPLPESPPVAPSEYDFQVVQLPLRSLIPDLTFAKLQQDDIVGHDELLEYGENQIELLLEECLHWNKKFGLLTFVTFLIKPQQNLVGRLLPRFDLTNPVYLIDRLNVYLAEVVSRYNSVFCVDVNEIFAGCGTRYVYEDPFTYFNHGGLVSDFDHAYDRGKRLEEPQALSSAFESGVAEAIEGLWLEIEAMYRTIEQQDQVKLVVVDLDDTMWRGTLAEAATQELGTTEGWPLGLWEALAILKRRGIVIAIVSKNEEDVVVNAWPEIFKGRLSLDDFAVRKINWAPKSQNMAAILAEVNVKPMSALYIDDNPAQRAEIVAAFPGLRVLGGTPTFWRRILLWAPETQVAHITDESTRRTEMVQAQVERERTRSTMSQDDFLKSLQLKMKISSVDPTHKSFGRAHELLNKTNQFNTTGRRWSQSELIDAISKGLQIVAFDLEDRFTQYGLVGVLLVEGDTILQYVMSCRIMGLGAEQAILSHTLARIAERGFAQASAIVVETEWNLPCRNVYERAGFVGAGAEWRIAKDDFGAAPQHIFIEKER